MRSESSYGGNTSDESETEVTVLIRGHYSYHDEPLANPNEDNDDLQNEGEIDDDGLSPAILEAIYLNTIAIGMW